ncbi:MAG: hypothetical protein ACF8QF_08960 [Phycisphaerales bacterium]
MTIIAIAFVIWAGSPLYSSSQSSPPVNNRSPDGGHRLPLDPESDDLSPREDTPAHTDAGRQFLKSKLVELDRFRLDSKFHQFGFGAGGPYNSWLRSVESKQNARDFSLAERVAIGDLHMLAFEYLNTNGQDNDYTRFAREQINDVILSESSDDILQPATEQSPEPLAPSFSVEQVEAGRALHSAILDRHPLIDASYRRASLWGALSNQPLAVIWVPSADWQALSERERAELGGYAASLVDAVRALPLEYSGISASAPTAPIVIERAASMTSESWGIGIGSVSNDGKDILADAVLPRGDR